MANDQGNDIVRVDSSDNVLIFYRIRQPAEYSPV